MAPGSVPLEGVDSKDGVRDREGGGARSGDVGILQFGIASNHRLREAPGSCRLTNFQRADANISECAPTGVGGRRGDGGKEGPPPSFGLNIQSLVSAFVN